MWRAMSGSSPRGFLTTVGADVGGSGTAVVAVAGWKEMERGSTRLTGMAGRTDCTAAGGAGGGEVRVGAVRLGDALGEEGGVLGAEIGLATQAKPPLPTPPLLPLPPSLA